MQSMKGCRRVVLPAGRWSVDYAPGVWFSLWGCLTRASNGSWSAFSFLNSFSWHHSISAMRFWSYWRVSVYVIVVGGGLKPSKLVSHSRLDRMLTMDEQERDDETPWGIFYRGPAMGAKCIDQNPELAYGQSGLLDFTYRLWERYLLKGQKEGLAIQRTPMLK